MQTEAFFLKFDYWYELSNNLVIISYVFVLQLHGWAPEKSVKFIREIRPHILLRKAQWAALETFHQNNIVNKKKA